VSFGYVNRVMNTLAFTYKSLLYSALLFGYNIQGNNLIRISNLFVGFEVFTAMTMKNVFFWDVMPCFL
jgi:hypothetical protein